MNSNTVVRLVFCVIAIPQVFGFTCYRCSYSPQTEGSRRECIEKPAALGMSSRLECNSTSYCVLQEMYDIQQKQVTSYFRSCSGNSWGNECSKDYTHVACKGSCRGNYCNENDVGKRYEAYLRDHTNDIHGSGNIHSSNIVWMVFSCVVYLLVNKSDV